MPVSRLTAAITVVVATAVAASYSLASPIDAEQANWLLIDAFPIDTTQSAPTAPAPFRVKTPDGPGLRLVQFDSPVRQSSLERLKAIGVTPIRYVPTNGYLVWADFKSRAALDALVAKHDMLRFNGVYESFFKVAPTLRNAVAADPDGEVEVLVQRYRHADGGTKAYVATHALAVRNDWERVLEFENVRARVRHSAIVGIAELPDVVHIGEYIAPTMDDEVQNQIIAGHLDAAQEGPSGLGYLAWLSTRGFPTDPQQYPIVNVTDSGLGNGNAADAAGDTTLRDGGQPGDASRVTDIRSCTGSASDAQSVDGHGHINASIVGGFDARTNSGGGVFQDPAGFNYGLGVNPFARIANVAIFKADGSFHEEGCGGSNTGVIAQSVAQGAAISSNSWGCAGCAGLYDEASQAYDTATRDADPAAPGDQPIIMMFSAGNSGPDGPVGTPGLGKNVITVGASENHRPDFTDLCVGPIDADDAKDLAWFSSRGAYPGDRVKPELVAPGSHITGTASTSGFFNGAGVCGGDDATQDIYYPSGQTVFTSSTGTSHSAPAISGLASLVYYWIEHGNAAIDEIGGAKAPSPAMTKAYLMAHTTYLTGDNANDNLPSIGQGYGRPTMEAMFDDTKKVLVDQTELLDSVGDTYELEVFPVDDTKPVRIALAYTDAPSVVGVDPRVNDLDLSVVNSGDVHLGNHFSGAFSTTGGSPDRHNNYEAVFLPAGVQGSLHIKVEAADLPGDGLPSSGDETDQDFALICSNCERKPTFTLAAEAEETNVCAGDTLSQTINVGSVLGFSTLVDLSLSGLPLGTSANFMPTSVTPPGTSTLDIATTIGAPAGVYPLIISGVGGGVAQQFAEALHLSSHVPPAAALNAPDGGAVGTVLRPTLRWADSDQAFDYVLELARDADFVDVVYSQTLHSTSWIPPADLDEDTAYFWRVLARNACKSTPAPADGIFIDGFDQPMGQYSPVRTFRTGTIQQPIKTCSSAVVQIPDGDPSGVDALLSVDLPDGGSVHKMLVEEIIIPTHSREGQLAMELGHGAGQPIVRLANHIGGEACGSGFFDPGSIYGLALDDQSPNGPIDSPNACWEEPPTGWGSRRPTEPLRAMYGAPANGLWTLHLTDQVAGFSGPLTHWCVTITPIR